ncbi:MAG: ABC transporter ATP-binding protein/permease [Synergistaceae bacterium]|nr:ABC transporter ATP-binding protein/permease [Synergistaceae bacterium]
MRSNKPFRKNRAFRIGVIFTVIEGILTGCSYLSIFLVLTMLQNKTVSMDQILRVTGIIAAIFSLRLVIYSFGYTQSQIGGAAVSKQIRLFLGEKLKKIPLSRFTQGQVGQYVNTMTGDVNNYEKILTHKIGSLAKNIALSVILICFICSTYLPVGLVLLAAELLLIPELWLSFRVVKKYGKDKNEICAETVSGIVEYITGIQTFRAYGLGGIKNKATTNAMKAFSDVCYLYEAHGIPVSFAFNIVHWLTIPVVMAAALKPWMSGMLETVDFLMLCLLPILLVKLTSAISIDLFSYKNYMISKNNILKVANEREEQGNAAPFVPASHDIAFKDVSFFYVPGEPVLNGVTFHAENQKLTAIVGDSGSGKSTILNLIAKYYESRSGMISIGGKSIEDITAERVLEQISMVDQDVFLFDDTIRENIRHARPEATDIEVEAACREANCDDFIQKMENGYDTETGENGNRLSGGERQRLSIARAILKNSPIILLDEVTASLDIENELLVKQAISNLLKQKKTVVMIAHILSIVKHADQILVVDGGKIVEAGTHETLLKKNGKYSAMWNAEQILSA